MGGGFLKLSEGIFPEVRVGLVPCDGVAARVDEVVEGIHGFVEVSPVLVFLVLVVAELFDAVDASLGDEEWARPEEVDTCPHGVRPLPCGVDVESMPVDFVDGLGFGGVGHYHGLAYLFAS